MSHASVLVVIPEAKLKTDGLEKAVEWEMKPFYEDKEWFQDGSRWDWYQIGGRFSGSLHGQDAIQIKELDLRKLLTERRDRYTKNYHKAMTYTSEPQRIYIYGVKPEETLEDYLKRRLGGVEFPPFYAFLNNRHWNERERMGWWGTTTYTECERKDMNKPAGDPEAWFGKCLHKDEESGARIICWNEPEEIWNQQFHRRFIKPLESSTYLAVVDYHV